MEYEDNCLDLKYPVQGTADKEMTDCIECERTFTVEKGQYEEYCQECREMHDFMRSISKN